LSLEETGREREREREREKDYRGMFFLCLLYSISEVETDKTEKEGINYIKCIEGV
jgi:hypothetical protein